MTEDEIYDALVGLGSSFSDAQGTQFYQSAFALAQNSGYDMDVFDKAVSRYFATRGFDFSPSQWDPDKMKFVSTNFSNDGPAGATDRSIYTDSNGNPIFPNVKSKRVGQPDYDTGTDGITSVIPPRLTLDDIRVAGRPLMTAEERQQYLPSQERRWWEVEQRPAYSPTPGPMLNFDKLPPITPQPEAEAEAQPRALSTQETIANIINTSPRGEIAAQRITDYAASQGLSRQDIAGALTPDITAKFGISGPVSANQVGQYLTRTNMSIDPLSRISDPNRQLEYLASDQGAVGKGDYTQEERAFRIADEARRQGLDMNEVSERLGINLTGFANGGEAGGIGSMLYGLGERFQDLFKPAGQKALESMTTDDLENMTIQQAKSAMETYERMMKEAGNDQEAIRRAQMIYKAETDNISDDTMMKAVEELRIDRNRTGTAPFAQGGIVDDRTTALNQRYGGLGSMTNQMGGMINSDMVSSIDRIMERQRG